MNLVQKIGQITPTAAMGYYYLPRLRYSNSRAGTKDAAVHLGNSN